MYFSVALLTQPNYIVFRLFQTLLEAPVVEEPKFKKGDRVKIDPTVGGNLKVWPDVILQLEKTDFRGTIIEEAPDRMEGGYYVNIGGLEHFSQHFFFNRELTLLVEEKEIEPVLKEPEDRENYTVMATDPSKGESSRP